jgi:hypothetical protein
VRNLLAIARLLSASIVCLLGIAIATLGLAFSNREAPQKASGGTLTFTERVAHQRAIEEVYWRHRIWPKENPGPKPPLDAIVSQRQIEQKVEDYLHKSQLINGERGSLITPSELQVEMDRMAQHTKQPEVLRELFAALGNDPLIIAECLARPIVAERLLRNLTSGRDPAIAGGRPLFSVHDSARPAVAPDQIDDRYKLPESQLPALRGRYLDSYDRYQRA